MLVSDRSARLTVRLAPYRDAILAARKIGLTWADLARIFGVRPDRLRWAALNCEKYAQGADQLPLPDPDPERQAAAPRSAPGPEAAAPESAQASAGKEESNEQDEIDNVINKHLIK